MLNINWNYNHPQALADSMGDCIADLLPNHLVCVDIRHGGLNIVKCS